MKHSEPQQDKWREDAFSRDRMRTIDPAFDDPLNRSDFCRINLSGFVRPEVEFQPHFRCDSACFESGARR